MFEKVKSNQVKSKVYLIIVPFKFNGNKKKFLLTIGAGGTLLLHISMVAEVVIQPPILTLFCVLLARPASFKPIELAPGDCFIFQSCIKSPLSTRELTFSRRVLPNNVTTKTCANAKINFSACFF